MGRTIKVDPARLKSTASQVEAKAGEYRRQFTALYNQVDQMQSAWQGKDNVAFTQQIQGFRDDFESMARLMSEYAAFLKNAARVYEEAQDDVISRARQLSA